MSELRAAEFFAGIGLMRLGLSEARIATRWANDIEDSKRDLYIANFGPEEFVLADVRDVSGAEVPEVEIATASFPCTDLSLAGNRRGLGNRAAPRGADHESSMFWEFARVIEEMGRRKPAALLLENVLGFASSRGGQDLREAVRRLNDLGYSCDLLSIDARHFVPQSRPRMFIVGLKGELCPTPLEQFADRPQWAQEFRERNSKARLHSWPLPPLPEGPRSLAGIAERLSKHDDRWWSQERVETFAQSLSPIQETRLAELRKSKRISRRTAYRRTRKGTSVWEIRADGIAGCLRTARGGSSKQALVEAGRGDLRVRWMTPREYARLMGATNFKLNARRNQALFGFGDAVCVPVIRWLCEHYVAPAVAETSDLLAAA